MVVVTGLAGLAGAVVVVVGSDTGSTTTGADESGAVVVVVLVESTAAGAVVVVVDESAGAAAGAYASGGETKGSDTSCPAAKPPVPSRTIALKNRKSSFQGNMGGPPLRPFGRQAGGSTGTAGPPTAAPVARRIRRAATRPCGLESDLKRA